MVLTWVEGGEGGAESHWSSLCGLLESLVGGQASRLVMCVFSQGLPEDMD